MQEYFDPIAYGQMRAFLPGEGTDLKNHPIRQENGTFYPESVKAGLWQIGCEWEESRDIKGLSVELEQDSALPSEWFVEYWGSGWPRQAPAFRLGASNGWLVTADPYHGAWRRAWGEAAKDGNTLQVRFDPLDIVEFEKHNAVDVERFFQSDDLGAEFRRTLKVRLMMRCDEMPKVKAFSVIGAPEVENCSVKIYLNVTGKADCPAHALVKTYNSAKEKAWTLSEPQTEVSFLKNTTENSGDATQLLFRFDGNAMNFAVDASQLEKEVYIPAVDILIVPSTFTGNPAETVHALTAGMQSITDKVRSHAEQTLENAFREIPEMDVTKQTPYGRYVVMGWEGVREKFALRYNGDVFADKQKQKVCKRDCAGTKWAGGMLHFRVGTGDPISFGEGKGERRQYAPEAEVPAFVTEWTDRHIFYEETVFAMPKALPDGYARGDEEMLLYLRFKATNTSDTKRTANLALNLYPNEILRYENNSLYACGRVTLEDSVRLGWKKLPYAKPRLRLATNACDKGEFRVIPIGDKGIANGMLPNNDFYAFYDGVRAPNAATDTLPNTLLYEADINPHASATVDFVIPYKTYEDENQSSFLRDMSFDEAYQKVREYWKAFYAQGAHVSVPKAGKIEDFLKAVPWHIRVTASRDVENGQYVVPAGTYFYGACGNEACMQIELMDRLGYHEIAQRYLNAFIDSQGAGNMDGLFQSREGALVVNDYSNPDNDPDMMFAYNLDHGYILQCMADHFRITGNVQWLKFAAPTMIRAMEFVERERLENGLLPPGRLEDNAEWRCWFAVNAHACAGVIACADVLSCIDAKGAERFQKLGLEYREAILKTVYEGISVSGVVPDGRGGYMPQVPIRTQVHGRDWGWFRQTAYGPLHLAEEGVLDACDPLTDCILQDLEENLFISRNFGRNVDKEKNWFSLGGNAVQSNLLFNDLTYLKRNEKKFAVRSLFNNFAQNLYRDVNCFTEHPIPEFGFGYGPFFKSSDEAQFLVNFRNHLILEEGTKLHLLKGCAEEWLVSGQPIECTGLPTYFGKVSLTYLWNEKDGSVSAEVSGDWRTLPEIVLHLPQKGNAVCVIVDGTACEIKDGCITFSAKKECTKIHVTYRE